MSNRLFNSIVPWVKGHVSVARIVLWCVLLSTIVLPASQALALPGIRFQWTTVRATIPVNSTTNASFNAAVTNNSVVLVDGVTNAIFDIAGLPPGVTATLQDTNGTPLTSITGSSNVWLVLNAANVPEGTYTFTLDASGTDTNGNPATNFFPFVLQSAHVWYGSGPGALSFAKSNNWALAGSWLGGVPASADDVVIADLGSQTNLFGNGQTYTNIGLIASATISSLRFAQSTHSDVTQTNAEYHNLFISNNVILSVTGAVGFSVLRDYVDEFGYSPDSTMGVMFSGNSGSLMVSNANANFGVLIPSSQNPSLVMSNLGTFVASVNRFGVSDYQLYPNYVAMNGGYNGGRDTNQYNGLPRHFWSTVFLARTNIIKTTFADPNNYTNEATRSYALSMQNNELSGNGSSVNTFFMLGVSNAFFVDSVCFIGANSASGNGGGTKFWATRVGNSAFFRGTNGGRMSVFTVSDDGGPNEGNSNVKSTTDFWNGTSNQVDILADRFYIARDRTLIASNQTPNVQGDVTIGYGNVDVNTAVLGFQEHSNKIDWTTLYSAAPYLNYCQGRLVLTNGGKGFAGTFKVNGNLTLGYTADMNPAGSAQQYNTYGRITIYSNVTLIASNIICDGGLNYYDSFGRQNTIAINQGGNLVVSNTIGFPNLGASDFSAADPRGMLLDSLQIAGGATLTLQVDPSRTNVFVRQLTTPGIIPGVIKVARLTGVSSYPIQIPVISYQGSATPFLNADVSALGAGFYAYVLNNAPNQTVDIFITTNAPNSLVWTGSTGNNMWDTNSANWVPLAGGAATNFHTGDVVLFNDSSAYTNITVADQVVPGQTGAGVTISNSIEQYTFTGGQVAGTALMVKQGTNSLEFDAAEQGPINITAGAVTGSGSIGNSTVWSNAVLNYAGSINGGLTSTGAVYITSSGTENGPVFVQGGLLDNSGTINTTVNQLVTQAGGALTNELGAVINAGTGPGTGSTWDVQAAAILANFGTINLYQPRIQVEGLLFGNGFFIDPNGGGVGDSGSSPSRVLINQGGTMGIGQTPSGTIDKVNLECRFDFNNDPTANPPGVSTILVDYDPVNQTNDVINCDRWNNDTGLLLFTNINPGPLTFVNGQIITIFNNSSGTGTNNHVDTTGFAPLIQPYVPGPGLVWNVTNYNTFGTIAVTNIGQIWDGTATGNWSTNNPADTSWKTGQTYTDFGGAYFDDSASGTTVVNLTSTNSPGGIRGTNAAGQGGILDSNQPTFLPGMIISNATKSYVFTGPGKISGVTGIYKTGSGTATLMTTNANDFSGNVIIDNGTLAVSNAPGSGSIASLGAAGGGQMKNDLILDGGTLSYVGLTNVSLNQSPSLFSHNGTFAVMSPTNMFTIGKTISGVGSLTKAGPGTLALASTANIYSGGTIVGGGTLRLVGGGVPGLATASVTFLNGTSLEITNNINLSNALDIAGGPVGFRVLGAGTNVFFGSWSGGGPVTFSNNNVGLATFAFSGDLSAFSGSISLGSTTGSYVFNNATNNNPCTGSALASFDLGTGGSTLSNFNGAGLTYNLGSLAGGANTILAGRMSNSPVQPSGTTYSIGANGNNTTFAGRIADGLDSVAVVKVGTGSLLLNGINTFSGGMSVSNGALGGTGSIASALNVTSGGTIAPGAPLGTFTVNNSATLGGTAVMELNVASSPKNSALSVSGTLTGGGALVVTNVGPNIANGTRFPLFNKAVTGFTSITLPATDPSNTSPYSWQTNLATDGSITLITGGISVNTNPTNITVSVSGNNLTLSWPGDHLGWELQSNPISLTTTNMWFPVAGSTAVTQQNLTIDLTKTNVFFRMVYPPQ